MENNKKYWVLFAVLGVAAIAAFFWIRAAQKPAQTAKPGTQNQNAGSGSSLNSSSTAENLPPNSSSTPTSASGQTARKLPYGEAILTYPNRFQFINCSGKPGTIAIKLGVPIMLDNRDNKGHTIKIDGQTVYVKALDYQIVYPKQLGIKQVLCDGGGAAVTNVQK